MRSLIDCIRVYLGGDEYKTALQNEIKYNRILSKPLPNMGKCEQRRMQEHRTKFFDLQELHLRLYGHTYEDKKQDGR